MEMQSQLILPVQVREDARFANFYTGVNEEAIKAIQQQWTVQGENYLYLWGENAGCSHLLQAACHYADGLGHHSVYLPLDELVLYGTGVLESMESMPLVAIDHLQAIAGNEEWEEAIFHLYNRVRDNEGHLLIAANQAPVNLGIGLADLVSRLNWGVVFELEKLEPEERALAIVLKAKFRGILFPIEVARFLVNHGPSSMSELTAILDKLDKASLAEKRKITIPFLKDVLGWKP